MARPGRPRKYDPIADEIRRVIWRNDLATLKALITSSNVNVVDGEARTPLFDAIIENNADAIDWLIASGANVNHQDRTGWSPLHFAVQEKQSTTVSLLLQRGADANIQDLYGNGPLWRAAFDSRGDFRLIEILLAAGADPGHKNKAGKSPFDVAVAVGDEALKALLKSHAD